MDSDLYNFPYSYVFDWILNMEILTKYFRDFDRKDEEM